MNNIETALTDRIQSLAEHASATDIELLSRAYATVTSTTVFRLDNEESRKRRESYKDEVATCCSSPCAAPAEDVTRSDGADPVTLHDLTTPVEPIAPIPAKRTRRSKEQIEADAAAAKAPAAEVTVTVGEAVETPDDTPVVEAELVVDDIADDAPTVTHKMCQELYTTKLTNFRETRGLPAGAIFKEKVFCLIKSLNVGRISEITQADLPKFHATLVNLMP